MNVTVGLEKSVLAFSRHAESGTRPDSASTDRLQLSPHSIRVRATLARNSFILLAMYQALLEWDQDLKSDFQYASICLTSGSGSDT